MQHMIQDQKQIHIDALPEAVFEVIETMPNKFPVYLPHPVVFLVPRLCHYREVLYT